MATVEFSYLIDFACFNSVLYNLTSGLLARNNFMSAQAAEVFQVVYSDFRLYTGWYDFGLKVATLGLLFYIGLTDLRTFKIHNLSLGLLLVLYALYAAAARSLSDVISDVVLCAIVFAILIWFYSRGAIGGGDVKLLPIACLWLGIHCAFPFSVLLLVFILVQLAAAKAGRLAIRYRGARWTIPYAPSVCGALAVTIFIGCV